jgi:2-polyprenyl-3-methyl-5-hydroxy-6-metoxy-1,4-benzoquinol methylase
MYLNAMNPYHLALWDLYQGDTSSPLLIRREDGLVSQLQMQRFLRGAKEFSELEVKALDLCKWKVLDAGAGTGSHALELQRRGHQVLAIDIAPHAVEIMKARGVQHAQCVNLFDLDSAEFDTLIMLMHGIGLVETLIGLDKFLTHARNLLKPDGVIVFDSLDVQCTTHAVHVEYQNANRKAGRYIGEIRSRFEYKGQVGDYFNWLHVDPDTLRTLATRQGWTSKIIHREPRWRLFSLPDSRA